MPIKTSAELFARGRELEIAAVAWAPSRRRKEGEGKRVDAGFWILDNG